MTVKSAMEDDNIVDVVVSLLVAGRDTQEEGRRVAEQKGKGKGQTERKG